LALEARYAVRPDSPVERLVESLAALLTVRRRRIPRQRMAFLDTCDGRVGRAGACLTLTADAGANRIQWQQGDLRVGCALSGAVQFAWDLPRGPVRQRIEAVIEMRRLVPLAEIEQDGTVLDVLDDARKTVARLAIVAGRARASNRRSPWQPFQPFLRLNALRGYDGECAAPIAIIESRPGIERTDLTLQGHVLHAIGMSSPQDVSVYRVELEPGVSADIGCLRMQRELLRIITANHTGILASLDSAFLHDFRAGVRRSRSLLGEIKGALPQVETDYLETELSWLTAITGRAHGLDGLLLRMRSQSHKLNIDHRGAIVARLEQKRARAQRALTEQLTSERYRGLVTRWTAILSRDAGLAPDDAMRTLPLATTVCRNAWRLYQCALAGIEHVRSDTPADELHRIRIDLTKLRDLIDAAASLFGSEDLVVLLRALEPLQSVLGGFEDARVQACLLRRCARTTNETEGEVIVVGRAAEALAATAERHAEKLRKHANEHFLRFGEPANRAAFERVFHSEQPAGLVQ